MKFPAALLLLVLLVAISPLPAETITVTVNTKITYKDRAEERLDISSAQNAVGDTVLMPIGLNGERLISLQWYEEPAGNKLVYVKVQDPTVILPGVANESGITASAPLTTFSGTFPYTPGKKIKIYQAPRYTIWLQIDADKE
jgi:hypothetical protein